MDLERDAGGPDRYDEVGEGGFVPFWFASDADDVAPCPDEAPEIVIPVTRVRAVLNTSARDGLSEGAVRARLEGLVQERSASVGFAPVPPRHARPYPPIPPPFTLEETLAVLGAIPSPAWSAA